MGGGEVCRWCWAVRGWVNCPQKGAVEVVWVECAQKSAWEKCGGGVFFILPSTTLPPPSLCHPPEGKKTLSFLFFIYETKWRSLPACWRNSSGHILTWQSSAGQLTHLHSSLTPISLGHSFGITGLAKTKSVHPSYAQKHCIYLRHIATRYWGKQVGFGLIPKCWWTGLWYLCHQFLQYSILK